MANVPIVVGQSRVEDVAHRLRQFKIANVAGHMDVSRTLIDAGRSMGLGVDSGVKKRARELLKRQLEELIPAANLRLQYTWSEKYVDEKGEECLSSSRHWTLFRIFLACDLTV